MILVRKNDIMGIIVVAAHSDNEIYDIAANRIQKGE